MGKLKVLPSALANMIAAGEVVQRPSSVIKELLENSVDAGATQITVIVKDAGRTLLQVIDNGCGMSPSDAVLCFERHATSKISAPEDLEAILTYGFRGEALASIAAVAEVTLRTRRASDDTATQVCITQTGTVTSSVSAPVGSNFAVRNLFYNTPARRKFLKSDNVELKHIVEEFTRVAVTRPETAFTLIHNDRELFVLGKARDQKFRIMNLLGTTVAEDLLDLEATTTTMTIHGFVGRPDAARKTLGNQYFFVLGRFFRSAYLHKAVMKAYEEMIPEGVTPSYFIFIDTDPAAVDVNIHPTKAEIKFEDESIVFQTVYAAVKQTLGKSVFGSSIDFDLADAVALPQTGRSFDEYKGPASAPQLDFDPNYNPFEAQGEDIAPNYDFSRSTSHNQNYGVLFEQSSAPVINSALTVQGKYIVMPSASGVMIVNIKRARERILYEQSLRSLGGGEHVTQTALFPVQVRVGVEQRLLFDESADLLASLGFDISPLGTDTVAVNGVPEGYSCERGKVEQMVSDLVFILSDNKTALSEILMQKTAEKFATLGALNCTPPANAQQASAIVDALFSCENTELTPAGKRIVSIIETEEIDKRFQ